MNKIMLRAALMLLASVLFFSELEAQSVQIFYSDMNQYPLVTTGFKLFDAGGNEIRNTGANEPIKKDDIVIWQDGFLGSLNPIADPKCPPLEQTTFSAILVVDISTSMDAPVSLGGPKRMDVVKEVLSDFISKFDPLRTEVAITVFADDAYGNDFEKADGIVAPFRPFTNDKYSLKMSINQLSPFGPGTDFNNAFLWADKGQPYDQYSALYWCKPTVAKYKPVIIFITDGNHASGVPFDVNSVSQIAVTRNATIYVIQIGDEDISQDNEEKLKQLAQIGKKSGDGTDNYWFDIDNAENLKNIYDEILLEAGTLGDPPPCYITWNAGCSGTSATFNFPNYGNVFGIANFVLPEHKKPELSVTPSSIQFKDIIIGNSETKEVTLTALKNKVEITGNEFIDTTGSGNITITDWGGKTLPFTLMKDSSIKITLKYQPQDTIKTDALMKFSGFLCSGGELQIEGIPMIDTVQGQFPKLELIYTETSLYPNMLTGFRYFDVNGNEVRDQLTLHDFIINEMESGKVTQRPVIDVTSPPITQTTASIVFTIEISNAMGDSLGATSPNLSKIDAVKTVLLPFIDTFDPMRNEIAMTLFCNDAIGKDLLQVEPFQPYTSDKIELIQSTTKLGSLCNGINYTAALLHAKDKSNIKQFSALYYTQPDVARYKPVVVLIVSGNSDGSSINPLISQEFTKNNALIYVIQLGKETPDMITESKLKQLAQIGKKAGDGTDNFWFGIDNIGTLGNILDEILLEAGTLGDAPPSYVAWKTGCEGGEAVFTMPNHGNISDTTNYFVSDSKKPELIFTPNPLIFNDFEKGHNDTAKVVLKANNNVIEIDGTVFVNNMGNGKFTIIDWGTKNLPFTLDKDSIVEITLQFEPADTEQTEGTFKFSGFVCSGGLLSVIASPKPVGVEDDVFVIDTSLEVILYPNPAESKITVMLPEIYYMEDDGFINPVTFRVFDFMGNEIFYDEVMNPVGEYEILTGGLQTGNYFLVMSNRYFSNIRSFVVYK